MEEGGSALGTDWRSSADWDWERAYHEHSRFIVTYPAPVRKIPALQLSSRRARACGNVIAMKPRVIQQGRQLCAQTVVCQLRQHRQGYCPSSENVLTGKPYPAPRLQYQRRTTQNKQGKPQQPNQHAPHREAVEPMSKLSKLSKHRLSPQR